MATDLVVNARIDALVAALDAAKPDGFTRGEQAVYAALLFAGTLEDAADRGLLTLSLGFVLSYLSKPRDDDTREALRRLCRHCHVEPDAAWLRTETP